MPNAIQIELLRAGIEYNGAALASGKVYTYKVGTTTEKNTYTDAAKTTPAANPIILDSNGRAAIFGDGVYKFVIKTSADVTLYTWDNLTYFSQAEDVGMYDALDYGASNFTQATIEAAITAIAGASRTLLLRPGSWNISSALSIPANINLKVERGALLTKSATGTITSSGTLEAGLYQIFSGFAAGDVQMSVISETYPEWWGENTTPGTTNMATAIQSAISAFPTAASQGAFGDGGKVKFGKGIYLINTGLVNNGRKVSLEGISIDNTTLKKGAIIDLIKFDSFFRYQGITNMTLDGNSLASKLIWLNTPNTWELENLRLINNGGTTADADAALYIDSATVGNIKNVQLRDNARNGYFNGINLLHIYDLKVIGGTVYDDMEFIGATDTEFYGLSTHESDTGTNGGFVFKACWNVKIEGVYLEHTHSVNVFTIGDTGQPTRGFTLKGLRVSRASTTASSKATVLAQLSSMGISIEDFYVTANTSTGAHTGGWIELAEVANVTLKNINAQSMNATVSAAGLIKSSSVGPDYVSIDGVYAISDAGTATIDLLGDYITIKNTNVPLNINGSSTYVTYENVSGAITDSNAGTKTGVKSIVSIRTLADSATPSVVLGSYWITGGTTTITNFVDGITGQIITIISEHAITITDGTNIFLSGSVNFVMASSDTLTLIRKGGFWYEIGRSDNT